MAPSMSGRVAVLVSGNGTNLQALLDDPTIRPSIAFVLSDRPDVHALARASGAGVPVSVIRPHDFADRTAFDHAVLDALREHDVDTLVSAGYMRLLGEPILDAFEGRWLNVHPALSPSFPGMHGVRDALEYGVKITGVTVFVVDEGVDTGPVVLQEAIEVRRDDTWDTVEPRIHELEHRLLPRAVRALLEGRLVVEGRHAWIEGE
jgi:phosphoribosylglycinamide formyltransferase-1